MKTGIKTIEDIQQNGQRSCTKMTDCRGLSGLAMTYKELFACNTESLSFVEAVSGFESSAAERN